MKRIVRRGSDEMPELRKKIRRIFPRRVGQHVHRECFDLVVGKRLELRNLGRVDPAFAKGPGDALIQILNAIAKSLGPKHLHRTEASDGEALPVRESRQSLFAHQPSKDRTQQAFDLRQRFFDAQRLAVDFDLIESCAGQYAPDVRGENLLGLPIEAPDLLGSGLAVSTD